MRIEPRLFLVSAIFYAVIGTVYWFTSYEPAGTVMLLLAVGAWALCWLYLLRQRHVYGLRPEDVDDPSPDASVGEVGYFPSSSAWPLGMGIGAVVAANGLVFGAWLLVAGGSLFLFSVVGFALEANTKT